ncbi:MAG: hypothetical protein ACYTF0_07730 [Planctomycetota bacterium]|jgi:hypothetical protein
MRLLVAMMAVAVAAEEAVPATTMSRAEAALAAYAEEAPAVVDLADLDEDARSVLARVATHIDLAETFLAAGDGLRAGDAFLAARRALDGLGVESQTAAPAFLAAQRRRLGALAVALVASVDSRLAAQQVTDDGAEAAEAVEAVTESSLEPVDEAVASPPPALDEAAAVPVSTEP